MRSPTVRHPFLGPSPVEDLIINSRCASPSAYFLQIFPAAKWLGINVTLWGVATACGAAAHNYQTLLVSRVFLGIFEATIAPSLMLISSHWYTKSEQAPRFCFWYTGLGIGQIIGGLVSYGFQNMSPDAQLSGWRTMFVVLGVITVLTGASVIFFLPDTPMKASWMSDSEKRALLRHVSVNQTGIENRKFRAKEIFEALVDPQIYLLLVSVVLVCGMFEYDIDITVLTLLHSSPFLAVSSLLTLRLSSGASWTTTPRRPL